MAEVAGEFTANLEQLSPRERKHASMRTAALSSTANALMSGATLPRLFPGGLDAIVRPGSTGN
jgi:hypothetical protein